MTHDLKAFTFGRGSHKTREAGMCVMEAVAYLAGEPHSDHPRCACPVITQLAIWVNDSCSDQLRQELLRDLPWRIVGTKASQAIERERGYMAADWSVRVVAPFALRAAGLAAEAETLEGLPPITSRSTAAAAADAALAASSAAAAAADSELLYRSAAAMLDRMIRLTEPQEAVIANQPTKATI